jgi:radical SAM superfamily enzyme YgiQ (UPF0313 family)
MKILLVQPNYPPITGFLNSVAVKLWTAPSITLQHLASITPNHHSIDLLNEAFQKSDVSDSYDLVAISSTTPTAPRAYAIADQWKEKGSTVVLGGYHPSALPHEAKLHADSVVIGEAENVWQKMLHDTEHKTLQPFYQSTTPADINSLPPLKQGIGEKNLWTNRIEATRGCPLRCEFCSLANVHIAWHAFRKKPIPHVIRDLQAIPQKILLFCDASMTIDLEYTKALFRAMKSLHKKFMCFGNAHLVTKDPEFLPLAQEAGCLIMNIGFESFSQTTMNTIGKGTNKVAEYKDIVKKIRDHGIAVNGQFIFGFDTDTVKTFQATTEAITDLGVDAPSINILVPYPGTPLFDRLETEDRILTKDWAQYTLDNVVFQPKQMSQEDLLDGAHQVVKTFYASNGILKRCLRSLGLGIAPAFMVTGQNLYARGFYRQISF